LAITRLSDAACAAHRAITHLSGVAHARSLYEACPTQARRRAAAATTFEETMREAYSAAQAQAYPYEPKPVIRPLGRLYDGTRDLSWPLVRLTAGGMLLVHGVMKVMPMAEKGFTATITAFATGSMARRGIEPALPAAYAIFFLETVGALMIMLGLFTRFIAVALAVEFAIVTFVAHWPLGFAAARGGWEYPLFWGLIFAAIALRGGGPYSLDRKLGWEL
jgi:putative oxidoreductase